MKFNRYIGWSLGVMALFSGCADNDFSEPYRPWDGEVPEELNIVVNVADPELVRVGETRADDGTINTLTVMQYDKEGHFLSMLTPDVVKQNGKYNINVKLDKSVAQLQFAANHSVSTGCQDLSAEVVTAALPKNTTEMNAWYPVLWGNVQLSDLLTSANRYEPEIVLYRQVAKVSVSNSASNFKLNGFGVYNTAEKGTVAPKLSNFSSSQPTVANGVSYSAKVEALSSDGVAYVYETDKESSTNIPKVIVEGEIDGKTYYYVAGFRNRTGSGASDNAGLNKYEYTPLDILRNHHYAFEITSVRGEGWPTLEDAINAQPDNRMTVWVSDINEEINDMVSSRDYLLGVQNEVSAEWNGKAEITVVSSYPKMEADPIKISLANDAATWIKVSQVEKKSETESNDNASGKVVKKIVYSIELDNNDKQTASREGKIVVRVGDLSREVNIFQEGRSLRRDRGAKIYGLTGVADATDYYDWVDNVCLGMRPEDNRGLDRNNALIFAAVPAYGDGIYYRIPKKFPGEEGLDVSYTLDNTADFSVDGDTDSENWIVKATENSKPKIATAKLTLTSSNGAVIDYDLLQVGYFHYMDAAYQKYTKGDFTPGWYYYEVVNINGYYLLDRNIGASTNNSFDPTSINYSKEDEKAKGFYFVVNPVRASFNTTNNSLRYQDLTTVTESLGMNYGANAKFNIPSESEFTAMGFKQNLNRGSGAVYVEVGQGKVSDSRVFIPAAGYFFGNIAKNPTHVNVWTRTLLGGSQGLMESDPEYGFQYRYLNVVGGMVGYQNLRTSAGAGGALNENLLNYLPLRLVWSETGSVVTPTPVGNYTYRICGIHGDWDNGIQLDQSNGKWSKVITVNSSSSFGIRRYEEGTNNTTWIYSGAGSSIEEDKPMSCVIENNNNGTNWNGLEKGKYTFTFDPSAMTLTVTKEGGSDPTPSVTYMLSGTIWTGAWTDKEMVQDSSNSKLWVLKEVEVMAGSFLVKGSDNSYFSASPGQQEVSAGANITLISGNDKKDMTIGAGKYTFTFNSDTKTFTVVKIGGSNPDPEPTPDEDSDLYVIKFQTNWVRDKVHVWGANGEGDFNTYNTPAENSVELNGYRYYVIDNSEKKCSKFGVSFYENDYKKTEMNIEVSRFTLQDKPTNLPVNTSNPASVKLNNWTGKVKTVSVDISEIDHD